MNDRPRGLGRGLSALLGEPISTSFGQREQRAPEPAPQPFVPVSTASVGAPAPTVNHIPTPPVSTVTPFPMAPAATFPPASAPEPLVVAPAPVTLPPTMIA